MPKTKDMSARLEIRALESEPGSGVQVGFRFPGFFSLLGHGQLFDATPATTVRTIWYGNATRRSPTSTASPG